MSTMSTTSTSQATNVSISHRYDSTFKNVNFVNYYYEFQSLIGTVQLQYLLRFLFSLYPISPVFQPFSPKKSVNLFIVNSRKALILLAFLFLSKLARRFTDFSAVFLLFSALFHAVFVLEALILLPWRFTDFFYIIFNNLHFNSTCTIHTYKGFPEFPAHSDRKWFLRHGSHRYSQYPAAIH